MSFRSILVTGLLAVLAGSPNIGIAAQLDHVRLAVANPERTDSDRERDASSKPAQVLEFFDLQPGHVVLDLFAGSGYYSEIAGLVVGETGTVYLHNNAAYLGFAGEALAERLGSGRLRNVERYDRELDDIDLPSDSVDRVVMVMTYHDLYYKTDGWNLDPESFFATIHRVLKPGGMLCIVDHAGKVGARSTDAQDLHRIDPEFARQDIEGRGFTFAGESRVLHNPDDQLDINVFDPSVRRRTSRFVYKFLEPVEPAG